MEGYRKILCIYGKWSSISAFLWAVFPYSHSYQSIFISSAVTIIRTPIAFTSSSTTGSDK